MDISYLKTVLYVAKYRSFSRAAEEIPCSQASVSRQVNEVEKALGYELFNRTTKRGIINVTERGRIAISRIEQFVKDYDELFFEPRETKQPTFRLGLSAGLFSMKAKYNLVSYVFEKHPNVNLVLSDADRTSWLNQLTENQIDGLLMHTISTVDESGPNMQPASQQNGLSYHFLASKAPAIAMSRNHPLANRESVRYEELKDETFLFNHDFSKAAYNSNDLLVESFLLSCRNAGFEPKIIAQEKSGSDFANVRDAAIVSRGWIYPTFQFKTWCIGDGVTFVPVDNTPYCANFFFVTLDRKPQPLDSLVGSCLKELCNMP